MRGLGTGVESGKVDRGTYGRVRRSALELLCVTAVCWLLIIGWSLVRWVEPASAATGHSYLSSLSEAPPGTPLSGPAVVAVDESAGTVFVGDPVSGLVDVYGAAGTYLTSFGGGFLSVSAIAVDEVSGKVYVADSFADELDVYKPDGLGGYEALSQWYGERLGGGEFGQVTGVAFDNSKSASAGDLYVLDARDLVSKAGVVDVFKPKPAGPEEAGEGDLVRTLGSGKLERPNAVAVSRSSGRVLVADSFKGAIYAFAASGSLEVKLNGKSSPNGTFNGKGEEVGNVAAVAVDEASEDIYVAEAERHAVSQYSADGEWEGWITNTPSGALSEPNGVALGPETDVYVADAGLAQVDRFGEGVVVPSVETGKVAKSGLTRTAALLAGTINGEGKAAQYRFQYGETPSLGSATPVQASGTGQASVSATIEGLQAGHVYYFRIVGENEDGATYGVVGSFESSQAVDGLETGPVKNVTPEAATLSGSLKRESLNTHYYFQYGTTSAYGQQSPEPPGEVPAAAEEKEEKQLKTLETSASGLQPNSTYHYRLVGENSYGTTYGADRTFTTSGPPGISYEPATGITQTEATIHALINPGKLETTYRFQYGETTAYGQETPKGGEAIGSGSVPVARAATLSGLQVGQTYHYRVVADNKAGATEGPDQTFTTVAPAPVDATYAVDVSATEATLHTQINPLGNDTHYYFQYGTQSCQANPDACTSTPAPPGTDIGAGEADIPGEVKLTGLQPDTTYHFRVLDSNSLGTTEGSEHTFTTQREAGSFALPDNRAWEMVSPPDKGGAPVEALTHEGGLILASENGVALTYVVNGALGEEVQGNRNPEMQQIVATRGASAWSSQDIATPSSKAKGARPGHAPEYQFFTPDLSSALVEPAGNGAEPPLAPGVTQATIYERDNATGTYVPLVTDANTAPGTLFGNEHINFVNATPDLRHVVISSTVGLIGGRSRHGLYEWSGGSLQFISLLPGGVPAKGLVELGFSFVPANALSRDGSRVIWTVAEALDGSNRGHLYMRDTTTDETLQLDAAQGVAEPQGVGEAQFQTASSDGSRVFFTDQQRLTADSTAEPRTEGGGPDLYECEITEVADKLACDLKDLTVEHNHGEHANVQGLLFGAAEDGTSVYLIAQGVLATNENGNGETAALGKNNLYELHLEGTQWSRTFIATLSGEDRPEWEGGPTKADTAFLTTRVSPNGRYLAFMSAAPITGYDNVDASAGAKGARDEEVFLYDASSGSLRCVSCNPSGARPHGVLDAEASGEGLGLLVDRRLIWGREGQEHWLAANIPGWTAKDLTSALYQSRYLSDEGRLYFDSPDNLVPAARNGKENVYQYEPSGVGSCQSPSGGCVSLVSGGSSDRESAFIEATPDGSNVFFVTEARLLPQDTDTAFDIYDARECSALSSCLSTPEPSPPGCGETETCRPAEPAQPIPGGAAGTASFSGTGNIVAGPPPAKHGIEAKKATRPLTRAQKLKRALESCRKHHAHAKKARRACERKARKRYGERHPATRSKKKTRSKRVGSGKSSGGGRGR